MATSHSHAQRSLPNLNTGLTRDSTIPPLGIHPRALSTGHDVACVTVPNWKQTLHEPRNSSYSNERAPALHATTEQTAGPRESSYTWGQEAVGQMEPSRVMANLYELIWVLLTLVYI